MSLTSSEVTIYVQLGNILFVISIIISLDVTSTAWNHTECGRDFLDSLRNHLGRDGHYSS